MFLSHLGAIPKGRIARDQATSSSAPLGRRLAGDRPTAMKEGVQDPVRMR
jgi:hypothetical protein